MCSIIKAFTTPQAEKWELFLFEEDTQFQEFTYMVCLSQ